MPDPRKCSICGVSFTPDRYHPNTSMCSLKCRASRDAERKRASRAGARVSVEVKQEVGELTTDALLSEIHARGYYALRADESIQDKRYKLDKKQFEGQTFKFAVMGDTHLGSQQQQLTHLQHFYHYAHEVEGITMFFHCGDLFNGSGKQHQGQEFENFVHGEDEQLDYAESVYPKIDGCCTKIIAGSHDYSFFKLSGSDIIKRLAERRSDIEYLGFAGAYIDITPEVDLYLHHPDGGTAYAVSYQPQKRIENFTPENKPRLCFMGHYHRSLYMVHRNVECLVVPCFQSQTPFLKSKGIFPLLGGWIVTMTVNKDGLARFQPELIRYYVPVERDY